MLEIAFQKIKDVLEARWALNGANDQTTSLILSDMDNKVSMGLLIEATDRLNDWIKDDPEGATKEETEALRLFNEARR